MSEYENRIQLMSQEIERLNYQIKGRSEELESSKMHSSQIESRFAQLEQAYQTIEMKSH